MKEEIEYNDLLNLNYAKKKHLPLDEKKPNFDDNEMRILYHQPMKRRVSKFKKWVFWIENFLFFNQLLLTIFIIESMIVS